jgi:predicted secreted hydrolase
MTQQNNLTLIPALFDPAADLAHRPKLFRNSWFLIGYVETAEGHKFNVLIHQIINSKPTEALELASILNITDISKKTYRGEELIYSAQNVSLNTEVFNNITPSSSLSGDIHHIIAEADFGWGKVRLAVDFPGKILLNAGLGIFEFWGAATGQYSIPWGEGGGELELEGKTYAVSGKFWFDRQWGFPFDLHGQAASAPDALRNAPDQSAQEKSHAQIKWTWMDLNLSNGIVLGLWEVYQNQQRFGWVTAFKPDGTHIIAAVEPLDQGYAAIWTSPESKQSYPIEFTIQIPSLNATLVVLRG